MDVANVFGPQLDLKKYLVEAVGTLLLVLTIALTSWNPFAAFAIGLMLAALIYIGGHISGGHYNPAVTTAAWVRGGISTTQALKYIVAQFLGAFGAIALFQFLSSRIWFASVAPGVSTIQAIAIEALLTFIFCAVILTVTSTSKFSPNHVYGLVIGLTLTAAIFAGGALSGGAFNPAVGVAPVAYALLTGQIADGSTQLLVYLVGPLLGGLLAGYVVNYLNK